MNLPELEKLFDSFDKDKSERATVTMQIVARAALIELLMMNHDVDADKITLSAMRLCVSNMEACLDIGIENIKEVVGKKDDLMMRAYSKRIYDNSKQVLELLVDEHLNKLTKQ